MDPFSFSTSSRKRLTRASKGIAHGIAPSIAHARSDLAMKSRWRERTSTSRMSHAPSGANGRRPSRSMISETRRSDDSRSARAAAARAAAAALEPPPALLASGECHVRR